MKVLLLLLVLGAAVTLPFAALHKPWAVRLWRKVRVVLVIYVLVLVVSTVVRLAFGWDEIYG